MLDVTDPNQMTLVLGMGTTRNEDLAAYYLRAAGVAAVWIDPDGHIGAQDVVPMERPEPGRIVYCCPRGAHFVLGYRLHSWNQSNIGKPADQAAIASKLEQLAADGGVGLTEHRVAAERALAAVATVNRTMETMKKNGELKQFNRTFQAARRVDPSLRYYDYLHAKKAALLEQLAREWSR